MYKRFTKQFSILSLNQCKLLQGVSVVTEYPRIKRNYCERICKAKLSMSEESRIISMKQVLEITDGMPFYLQTKPWRTEYAGPHVILIKDSGKKVFGGFLLSSWRLSKNEFSDREKQFWLSAYTNHTRIFKRTQKNRRLQMADETGFSIGAGENQVSDNIIQIWFICKQFLQQRGIQLE
ncbi:unnamed protein product [Paramecium octaurelia]|uniref:TLDc domain-containing protein n=1 Tax=Paramecium octaurelia TaxID=43137 RepID=A0A8S1WEF3_PAROT|nr:unnamed protein product [Paramecium octaurelia]